MSDLKKIDVVQFCNDLPIGFELQQTVTMTEGLACLLYHLQKKPKSDGDTMESQLKNNKEINCPPIIYPFFGGTLWFMMVKVVSCLWWNSPIFLLVYVIYYVQCHLKSFGPVLTAIGMILWIARITVLWNFLHAENILLSNHEKSCHNCNVCQNNLEYDPQYCVVFLPLLSIKVTERKLFMDLSSL